MDNITFTSRIRPVTKAEFSRVVSSYGNKNFVGYPWTIKESVLSDKAFTKDIADCTVCGITDGLKVLLIHLCPTEKINFQFNKVTDFIKEKFNLNNPDLQAILVGGKPECTHGADSYKLFGMFEKFLEDSKIPFSKLKGGMGTKDVAYSSATDEWIVSNDVFKFPERNQFKTAQKAMEEVYNEVKIADCDEVRWI